MVCARSLLIASWLGAAMGCVSAGAFECESSEQCSIGEVVGTCQSSGFCSFGDVSCDSGQRYGEHAPGGLAQACVPVEVVGTSTGPSLDSEGPASSGGEPEPDGSADGTSSGGPVVPPTTGSTTGSTTAPDDSSSEEGTGPGGEGCPTFFDDFDDGVIGAVWGTSHPEDLDESGGALVMNLTPMIINDATGVQQLGLDLTGSQVEVELGALPVQEASQVFLSLNGPGGVRLNIVAQPTLLSLRYGVLPRPDQQLLVLPLDPVAHRWIRFDVRPAQVAYEVSADGIHWLTLYEQPIAWDPSSVDVYVLGTNWAPLAMAEAVSVETVRMCQPGP